MNAPAEGRRERWLRIQSNTSRNRSSSSSCWVSPSSPNSCRSRASTCRHSSSSRPRPL
jgi:hypothetical protein